MLFTIEGVTPALASRVTNTLMASAGGPRAPHQSLAVTTAYDVEHDRLRILVASDLTTLRSFLALVDAVAGATGPGLRRPHCAAAFKYLSKELQSVRKFRRTLEVNHGWASA